MSSNHPYGGPQPPMPGPGANPGPGPGQPLSPYGYPQQPSPGGPPTSLWLLLRTLRPRRAGRGLARGPPAWSVRSLSWPVRHRSSAARAQPKGSKGKILIIVGAASLAVILMAVLAVVVATRAGRRPILVAAPRDSRPIQLRAVLHTARHGLRMRSRHTCRLLPPATQSLPCPTQPIQRQQGLC